ncbi:MAG: hypothetical protein GF308_09265 [Candidatus Heimdallarchaeota archaeon]|nr:hypothetical protein [Candidatus Heimdallarchaeota archaeon]
MFDVITKHKNLLTVGGASLIFILFFVMIFFPYQTTIKTDNEIEWQRMYGGSQQDWAYSIQQTADGGFIVAGVSESIDIPGCNNHGKHDMYVLKLDSSGVIEWQQLYGGSGNDYAYVIQQTSDGGYILIGESESSDIPGCVNNGYFDAIILKLDSLGNIEWQQMYGGSDYDLVISIQQLPEDGYIVAGETRSTDISGCTNSGNADVYILKLASNGSIIWQELFGGENADRALSIQQTSDDGFIVFGSSKSMNTTCTNHGDYDYYALKLTREGAIVWEKMFGGSSREWGFSIIQTSDDGFIACGLSSSTDIPNCPSLGEWDSYLIRLNSTGSLLWQKKYGGSSSDLSYKIQSINSDFICLGGSWSKDIPGCANSGERDYYLFKIDSNGDLKWQKLYGGSKTDYASSFDHTVDGGLIIAGGSGSKNIDKVSNRGEWDIYLIKLSTHVQL